MRRPLLLLLLFFLGLVLAILSLWKKPQQEDQDGKSTVMRIKKKKENKATTTMVGEDDSVPSTFPPISPFVPPAWIQDYIDFHQSQLVHTDNAYTLANNRSTPYFLYECRHIDGHVCGGIGDRLKGILTGFLFSLLRPPPQQQQQQRATGPNATTTTTTHAVVVPLRRVFLIQWQDHVALTDYLQPAHIQWQTVPPPRRPPGGGPLLSMEPLSFMGNRKRHAFLYNPCAWLDAPNGTTSAMGIHYRAVTLVPQSQLNGTCLQQQFGLVVAQQQQQQPRSANADENNLWHALFWTLFRFTDRVPQAAEQLLLAATAGSSNETSSSSTSPNIRRIIHPNYYVGVHVRTGGVQATFADPGRHGRPSAWQAFAECTARVQDALQHKCGSLPRAYVASDSTDAKQYLMQTSPAIHAALDIEIYHVDRSQVDLLHNVTAAADAVWVELYLLMQATCLVVSKSGYSYLAQHLSPRQPHCSVPFDACTTVEVEHQVREYAQCP